MGREALLEMYGIDIREMQHSNLTGNSPLGGLPIHLHSFDGPLLAARHCKDLVANLQGSRIYATRNRQRMNNASAEDIPNCYPQREF